MDYEKKYKEALEIARYYHSEMEGDVCCVLEECFSELRENESEDEKIRQALIALLKFGLEDGSAIAPGHNETKEQAIIWLEKQGTFSKKDVDDAYLKGITDAIDETEKQYETSYQIRKDIATFIFNYRGDIKDRAKWMNYLGIKVSFVEKQDEQNHTYKIEPKFHEGDWCIDNEDSIIFQIVKVLDNTYTYRTNEGKEYACTHYSLENDARLWTIQDAKDGDVLSAGQLIILFKQWEANADCNFAIAHAGVDISGNLQITNGHWLISNKSKPATKEQRDLLFAKIKDAGYEWNADKKELKKIMNKNPMLSDFFKAEYERGKADAQKHIEWNREDEKNLNAALGYIDDEYLCRWLKDVIHAKYDKHAWSEEDKKMIERLILSLSRISANTRTDSTSLNYTFYNEINWLKSLKERYTWKPTENQMKALKEACDEHWEPDGLDPLYTLYNDLKKLREE